MTPAPPALTPTTRRFLATPRGRTLAPLVLRFHHWVAAKHLVVAALVPEEVERFFAVPFRNLVSPRTAQCYKRGLIHYLQWLYEAGELQFDPRCLGIRRRRPLPPVALDFLRSLEPTLKPSTCAGYRSQLQLFHEWLDDGHLRLRRLTRPHMEAWLQALNDAGHSASHRLRSVFGVRRYLTWLWERHELLRDVDELLRPSDLPKLPSYLPRPLPPDLDAELQRRLRRSLHPLWRGLLLMRHTGLRIGELRRLEYNCVRTDSLGNRFLKVPLGKLDNERLVPLTDFTAQLIQHLQLLGIRSRPYLLEGRKGGPVAYDHLQKAFREATAGLSDGKPITTHRLRHTYATSLLDAGMSLLGIMRLLGHRDYRMTLRYTAISQEAIGREYFAALTRLQTRYGTTSPTTGELDPVKALRDITAWLQNSLGALQLEDRRARALTKRLLRLRADLIEITKP
jgi:site-specific recombinase XerD